MIGCENRDYHEPMRSSIDGMWVSVCRLGTVDDFKLDETVLRPTLEQYIKHRVDWLGLIS